MRLYACVLVLTLSLPGVVAAADDADALLEQQRARDAELQASVPAIPQLTPGLDAILGFSALLFIGVDDVAVPAYVVDPADGATQEAFTGFETWGAAVIPGASPGDAVVYFNNGVTLQRWAYPNPPEVCCTLTLGGSNQSVVSMAYDATAGELLFTRNITTEAVYSLPVTAGMCPASCEITQDIVYSTVHDMGGLAFDSSSGILYATDDGSTDSVVTIDGAGTVTVVAAYPAGQTDIDALAVGGGKLYLVPDQPGSIYVLDIGTATYDAPIPNPWTTSEIFSGAGFGAGLIPVELQSFGIE